MDSQGDGYCPICGTGSNSRHGSYVRSLQDLPARGTSVLIQATRRVAGPPRAPRFTCHKMVVWPIGMPRRPSARVPHRVKQSLISGNMTHDLRDLVVGPDTPERRNAECVGEELLPFHALDAHFLVARRLDDTGAHGVDTAVPAFEVGRPGARERSHGRAPHIRGGVVAAGLQAAALTRSRSTLLRVTRRRSEGPACRSGKRRTARTAPRRTSPRASRRQPTAR
jgi:hypothetical protein